MVREQILRSSLIGSTLSHYENMPIQIYENFTTKKRKFSDKKIWYFWGLLSEHLVYLRYISEKRQYRTTKIQVCLRISTVWLGFWINRDSVCVTIGEFWAKFSGFHKKHILRILSKRKPLRFFKPELSLHVFVWCLYKGNILFGHSHEYPTSLKCETHFELCRVWAESWFQRKTYLPLDMDGNYWKGTADVLSASFDIGRPEESCCFGNTSISILRFKKWSFLPWPTVWREFSSCCLATSLDM